jgi:hypothetical protein
VSTVWTIYVSIVKKERLIGGAISDSRKPSELPQALELQNKSALAASCKRRLLDESLEEW